MRREGRRSALGDLGQSAASFVRELQSTLAPKSDFPLLKARSISGLPLLEAPSISGLPLLEARSISGQGGLA